MAASAAAAAPASEPKRREIYTYNAPWPVYSLASSNRSAPEHAFRFAVGSFVEEYSNKVQVRALRAWRAAVQCHATRARARVRGTNPAAP